MNTAHYTFVGAGLLFFIIFLTGYWLSKSGRPLNGIVLTIHKLIALAAGLSLVVTAYQTHRVATLSTIELVVALVTGLLFLGTGIAGGLLSTDKPMPGAISWTHRITPFLTALSTAMTLYLLLSRK